MQVHIKNEKTSVKFLVKHTDSVALLKAKYQASGKCSSDYIVLLQKGKELEDERTLGEQGVTDGAILIHIEAAHQPFRGVNYRQLAHSLAIRRRHNDQNMKMLQQDNIWAPDERK